MTRWTLEDLPPKWRAQADEQLGRRQRARAPEAPECDRAAAGKRLGFVRIGSGRQAVYVPEAPRCGHEQCGERCHVPARWALTHEGRVFTANSVIGEHNVKVRNGKTVAHKQWAAQAAADARIPRLERAGFVCQPQFASRRSLPDPNADCLAAKAAVDGLVAVGVLPDDTAGWCLGVHHQPPTVDPELDSDQWTLTVVANPARWRLDTGV